MRSLVDFHRQTGKGQIELLLHLQALFCRAVREKRYQFLHHHLRFLELPWWSKRKQPCLPLLMILNIHVSNQWFSNDMNCTNSYRHLYRIQCLHLQRNHPQRTHLQYHRQLQVVENQDQPQ